MYTSVLAAVFGQAVFYRSGEWSGTECFLFACSHLFIVLYEERAMRAIQWRV